MGVVFKSNTAWRFVSGRRSGRAKGLPSRTHTWEGRYDQLESFLATYPLAAAHEGGYIIDHDIRDTAPKAEVDLVLALPPSFVDYSSSPSVANKVFQKTGTVTDAAHTLFTKTPYPTSIEAARTLSARVHSTTYRYFAADLPLAARFDTEVTGQNPRILSDDIIVTARFEDGGETIVTYRSYASAPAIVQTAIDIDVATSIESFQATPIDGTPWYQCQDQVIRGYEEA
jgi:hypothetical protein